MAAWVVIGALVLGARGPAVDLRWEGERPPVMTRLEAELTLLGYDVRLGDGEAPSSLQWTRGAIVGVTGKGTVERRQARFEDPGDVGVWAIRVTDWLRADPALLPAPSFRRWELAARGLLRKDLYSGLTGGADLGTGVNLSYWLTRLLGVEFEFTGPFFAGERVFLARSSFDWSALELHFRVRGLLWFALGSRFALVLGVGAGLGVVSGRLVFQDQDRSATTAVASLAFSMAVRFTIVPWLFVELRTGGSALAPQVSATQSPLTRSVGRPMIDLGLGLGASW